MINSDLNATKKKLTIFIPRDLSSTTAPEIEKDIAELLERSDVTNGSWDHFEVDLTKALMVDSAGLNLLISVIRRIKARNAKMTVKITSLNIHRTLLFTRLDKQIEIQFVDTKQ